MDEEMARSVISASVEVDAALVKLNDVIAGISDEVWRKRLAMSLVKLVDEIYVGIMLPVSGQFPHLDPYKEISRSVLTDEIP